MIYMKVLPSEHRKAAYIERSNWSQKLSKPLSFSYQLTRITYLSFSKPTIPPSLFTWEVLGTLQHSLLRGQERWVSGHTAWQLEIPLSGIFLVGQKPGVPPKLPSFSGQPVGNVLAPGLSLDPPCPQACLFICEVLGILQHSLLQC